MPLIVQKAFLFGPKFIYSNYISPQKVIDNLKKKRNTKMKALEQDDLYHELQNTQQKNQKEHINPKLLEKNMSIWLEKNNLLLQNADKNLCTVLIDKKIYNQHLNSLINDGNYTPIQESDAIKLVKNNYSTLYTKYDKFHRLWEFKKAVKSQKTFGFPNLYLIPKVHKPKLAFRPIVNQRNFLFTEIFKNIHQYYHEKLNKHPQKCDFIINGNMELIKKLDDINLTIKNHNINLQDYDIASLDVTNLYGNIDLHEINNTLKNTTNYKNKDDLFYITITQDIILNNVIEVNDNLYKQNKGLAMGINYAPSLANYYLFHEFDLRFNNMLQKEHRLWAPLLLYVRFLDDILMIYHKKWKLFNYVNTTLNNINQNIQFTTEQSKNDSINFMDLTIKLNKDTNQLEYTNFTKELKTNMMLHFNADFKHKEGLIKSQFIRIMKNNNNETTYEKDCQILEDGLLLRGYPQQFIKKCKLDYSERENYLNSAKKEQKQQEFSKLLEERKLLVVDYHQNVHIVKKHLRKKYENPLFVHKNYQNLYNSFFKNHKNTQYTWYDKRFTKDNNKSRVKTVPSSVPMVKTSQQKNTLLNYFEKNENKK